LLGNLSRRRRQRAANQHGFFRTLGVVGSLGWLIVLPILAGLALGRWLDGLTGGGIRFTGALLLIGVVIGCRLAWNRMHRP
jgi:ATP synthase protein I